MQRQNNPNLMILELAVSALGALVDDMVFIGGCATGLLITDLAAPVIHATKDVDVITEVASLVAYYRLSEQLRAQGFEDDQSEQAPICRWLGHGVILDGRPAIVEDVSNADEVVKNALEEQFSLLIKNERFLEAIPGHLPGDAASQARLPLIMERVEILANLE